MDFDDDIFDPFDPIAYNAYEEATGDDVDDDWRDEHRLNEFDLDPDDYDSEDEFLQALEEAEREREEADAWRDEHRLNEFDLDPDDYDSEDEFFEALEETEESENDDDDDQRDNREEDENGEVCGVDFDNEHDGEAEKTHHLFIEITEKLKGYITTVLSFGVKMDSVLQANNFEIPARRIIKHDLIQYCLHLCASKGAISKTESTFFNISFEHSLDLSGLAQLLKRHVDNSVGFESKIPLFFEAFMLGDRVLDNDISKNVSNMFIGLYRYFGYTMIDIIGGELSDKANQREYHENYISTLEKSVFAAFHSQ